MPFRVVFILFPNITQLDLTGPAQVLTRLPDVEARYAALTLDPIATDSGFAIAPNALLDEVEHADLVCVPGGFGVWPAMENEKLMAALKRLGAQARYVTAVCTGAFALGGAGFLAGKKATTHWAFHHLLPLVGAAPVQARVVRDGGVITGGGVTAGIDFGLTVAAEVAGERVARMIATSIEYDPAPPFGPGTLAAQSDEVRATMIERYRVPVESAQGTITRVLAAKSLG